MSVKEQLRKTPLIKVYRFIRWRLLKKPVVRRFYITREDLHPERRPQLKLEPKFELRELSQDDLPGIGAIRPEMSIERYGRMLQEGKRCFGILHDDRPIAKMWLNFDDFNSDMYTRDLEDDEAYLFDAFSNPDYRGNNLAPILRLYCYDVARQAGRVRIYSVTDYDNAPAKRFKEKLHAEQEGLYLYMAQRPYWKKTIRLRKFR